MAFEGLSEKLNSVFKRLRLRGKLKEADIKEVMREVRLALLEADVNYKVAKDFVAAVSEKALGNEVLESLTPAQQIIKIVNEEMTILMGSENVRIRFSNKIPTIIMMCGLQGSVKPPTAQSLPSILNRRANARFWLRAIFTVRRL
jgi:signal recognition particle subunit SRP54